MPQSFLSSYVWIGFGLSWVSPGARHDSKFKAYVRCYENYELCFDNLAMRDKYIKKMNQTSNTIYNNITHIFHELQ